MPNNNIKGKRFDVRSISLFCMAFGLATFNIWFASKSIEPAGTSLCESSGNSQRTNRYRTRQQQTMAVSERGDDGERNETVALSSEKQQWRRDTYNFTVGICAIVKDGEAYMTEWLDYHLGAMGVDAIYIYDNSFGDPSLELGHDLQAWHRNTRSHPLYSKVEVMHMPEMSTGRQKMAYTDCVLRYGKNVQQLAFDVAEKVGYWNSSSTSPRILDANDGIDYLAMIDIDEFLVPRGNYTSVHGVIKDYLDPYVGGSLTVNWMLFGSSNKTLYSPIPVTKRFQYRDEMPNGVVKSITQASDFGNVAGPHATNTVYGYRRTTLYRGAILENEKGTADPSLPTGALLLYHYRYTSHKEYHYKKCIRMETDGAKGCDYRTGRVITAEELERKGMPDHIAIRTGSVFDDSAWQLLSERVPKYRIYDDEAWVDYS